MRQQVRQRLGIKTIILSLLLLLILLIIVVVVVIIALIAIHAINSHLGGFLWAGSGAG